MYDRQRLRGVRLDLAAVAASVVDPDALDLEVGVEQPQTRVSPDLPKFKRSLV